ncbi:MAG TPA: alpha/beta fold hydrolase [Kaistia sp.]|nr:alpha/beta fold hydrolase [Kaistia sp.]
MTVPTETGRFALGDLKLQSGEVLPDATLSWKSYGTLSPSRDNVIVYPTSYTAKHSDQEWLIAPDKVLDPTRWFIVTPDMFGNGLSSSPSNTADYPNLVTATDNVCAQRRFLSEQFGIDRIAAVYGFSMGAQQAYHWAALYPDAVERAIIVAGSARTSTHNKVFLLSLFAALEAAPEYLGGIRYAAEPTKALRTFARIYAGWAMSHSWYRQNLHLSATGATDLEDFLTNKWAPDFIAAGAANLHAQGLTWLNGDISDNDLYGGDLIKALNAIKASILLLPGRTDMYFPPDDNALDVPHLARSELRPIPSIWGHVAGAPENNPTDLAFLRNAVLDWLDRPV